ncbi:MAG TPA: SRPBCC family protein, partial [Nitrospiraceae bacterium]|nr:SRPBCC family protein [Nitrospiraceae bacterium]
EALGWFSIGLGLAEIAAPRLLTRVIGVPGDHRLLLRLLGFREIASGLGLLSRRRPAFWMQSRVWGDMMDLVVLSAALIVPRTDRGKLLAATAAVAGVTWLDVLSSRRSDHEQAPGQGPIHVIKTVTVNRSAEDLYRFWRDFHNLPTVIPHLEAVHVMSETRSHWIAKAPGGITIEWDAEIVEDQHGHTIQWRSLESGDLPNEGRVRFTRATGDRGTVVRVELQYDPPAGRVGWLAARLLGRDPGEQLQEGLRRFKQRMEAGEIATTHGQPAVHEGGLAMVRR